MQAQINAFLKRFHPADDRVDTVFTNGCCYWFAEILHQRFPSSRICYNTDYGHFVTEIDGRLYDITGDVTEKYLPKLQAWDSFRDELVKSRIIRDCVNF